MCVCVSCFSMNMIILGSPLCKKNTSAPSFPRGLKEEPHRHRLGWLQDGASPQ